MNTGKTLGNVCPFCACVATGLQHFDIAYDAFELLAHPVYGVAMIEFRPVDCDTNAPLPFNPGFISK